MPAFKVSETAECLVAGHVRGLSCAGCTTSWLSYSHQCQRTDGAERLRPGAETVRRRDRSKVTGHRSPRRGASFTPEEHNSKKKTRRKARTREKTELDKEGTTSFIASFGG